MVVVGLVLEVPLVLEALLAVAGVLLARRLKAEAEEVVVVVIVQLEVEEACARLDAQNTW